jgi:hypothetical protein
MMSLSMGVTWQDDWWIWNDLEGSGYGLTEVLSQYLPGGTVENNKKPQ